MRCRKPGLALLLLLALLPRPVVADVVVADLSSHLIAINTGFTGASVVLFGAIDGPGDVIAVIRGPDRDLTVWRKGKVAGLWVNVESVTYTNIPSFYAVAASRPVNELVQPDAAALYHLGVDNLRFEPKTRVAPDRLAIFTKAMIDVQQRAGLFPSATGKIAFLGDRLFRTVISVPANVPTGTYRVEIFLVRDNEVVSGQTTPLVVSKVGVDAAVFDFARRRSLAYGVIAVLTAVMAGWIGSLTFRGA